MLCKKSRTAVPIIGPRQTTGVPFGRAKPMEQTRTPCFSWGRRPPSLFAWKPASKPIIVGTLGPVMSASRRPTLAPRWARATARLVATVDLPTPPLLEAIAMTFFTPSMGRFSLWPLWARTSASRATLARLTPGRARRACSTASLKGPVSGQAGVVRTRVIDTASPSILRSRTMFSDTTSRCSSGSSTWRSAARTALSLTASGTGEGSSFGRDEVAAAGAVAVEDDLVAHGPAQQSREEVNVPLAAAQVLGGEAREDAVVVADLEAAVDREPLGEAADLVHDLRYGGDPLLQRTALDGDAKALRQTVGGALDDEGALLVGAEAGDLRGMEGADLVQENLGEDVVASGERFLALGRQGEEVVRPAGAATHALRADEAVALEAYEVLAGGHGSDGEGSGGFLYGDAAGALEK